MIQPLQTNNEQLVEKINTIEKDNINLTDKIQSMLKGAETLSERICAVEFNNQNLLKSYDRLMDKVSLQEGNMHTIKIMSKDETLSLLDKFHTLESSVRALEQNTGQEIQTLQKPVVKDLKRLRNLLKLMSRSYKDRI